MPPRKQAPAGWTSAQQAADDRARLQELETEIELRMAGPAATLRALLNELRDAQAEARHYRAQTEHWRQKHHELTNPDAPFIP